MPEIDALVHHRHLAVARRTALEDAWLLGRLREHGLSMDQIARRLCRSKSWVSHRLGLIDALAAVAQDRVRAGTVPPHGAMRYLVPFARANKSQCEHLLARIGETRVSDRELAALYTAWKRADRSGKQRIVDDPLLFLKAWASTQAAPADDHDAAGSLLKDLTTLAAIAWRASRRAIAEHTRSWGRRQIFEKAEHRAALVAERKAARDLKGRDRLRVIVPFFDDIVARWDVSGSSLGLRVTRSIELLDLYGDEVFGAAATDLHARGLADVGALAIACVHHRKGRHRPVPVELVLPPHLDDTDVIPHDLGSYDE